MVLFLVTKKALTCLTLRLGYLRRGILGAILKTQPWLPFFPATNIFEVGAHVLSVKQYCSTKRTF